MIPDIQLAPMEGVLDWCLRELLSEVGGLDRMVTEFVRVTDRLLPDHVFRRYSPELEQGGKTLSGTPVFIQLLGGQPGPMAENAARAVAIGAPGIDLNFGCPAKTVNRHDGGAALLQNPERVFTVTSQVRAAVPLDVPVTAKVRLGFADKELHREIAQAVAEAGASHIVVHARTKLEMYKPPAHWEYIAQMREGLSLPFLSNGDIWCLEDYQRCAEVSGVTRVALGRGLVRRPTLALEIRGDFSRVREFDRRLFLTKFFEQSLKLRGEAFAVARLKQLLRYWSLSDSEGLLWFNQVKLFTDKGQAGQFLSELRKEALCPPQHQMKSPFTPGPTALTASAPRIC